MTAYHDAHLTPDPARAIVWRAVAEHLAPYIPTNAAVLEIGAGYCDWINHVSAARRVAIDAWSELPRFAAAGVHACVADLRDGLGGFGADSFDVVLASNVLEHFEPDVAGRIAGEVLRVLGRGGRLLVIQPNFAYAARRYFDDYTHRAIFTHVSLPALLRAQGFEIDEVQPRFLPYSMQGTRLPVRGWLVRAYLNAPVRPGAGPMLVVARKP